MSKPFFSVIILAFDRPDLLKRALDSVVLQTYKNYEILVIDGGPKHLSEEISTNYSSKPIYFKIFDHGIGKACDFGLLKAEGEWSAFLDDDDEYLPNHLEERYKIIVNDPNLDLLYNGFKTIYNSPSNSDSMLR